MIEAQIKTARRFVLPLLWVLSLAVLSTLLVGTAELGLRVRRQWIASHVAAPPLADDRLVADRLLRFKNRPNYQYGDRGARYTNNALGLRGPEIARTRPPGLLRVVLVGGSTVYGAMVDDSETISVQLETLLHQQGFANVEVINGGVPGYDALRELVITRAELLALEPNVVIDLDGLNDVFYGSLEEWPAQIASDELGVIGDGRIPEVVAMIDSSVFPNGLLEHQVTMLGRQLRPMYYRALHQVPSPASRRLNERIVALHAQSMAMLARYGREQGMAVVVSLQPLVATGHKRLSPDEELAVSRQGYWDAGGWAEIAVAWYARLAVTTRTAVEQQGGTFLDLTNAFDAESGRTYADDAVHYTALGNLRLAEALAPLVEERLRAFGATT